MAVADTWVARTAAAATVVGASTDRGVAAWSVSYIDFKTSRPQKADKPTHHRDRADHDRAEREQVPIAVVASGRVGRCRHDDADDEEHHPDEELANRHRPGI